MKIEERLIEIRKRVTRVSLEVEEACSGCVFRIRSHYGRESNIVFYRDTVEDVLTVAERWLVESEPWRKNLGSCKH